MTIWTPRSVVGYAQDAGWTGDDLYEAVRAAWAASQGNDGHASASIVGATKRYVGLWGVPVMGRYHPDRITALRHPATNAHVAFSLWRALGGFGWQQPRGRQVLAVASAIATSAVAAGRGVTLLDGGLDPADATPPGTFPADAPGGVRAAVDNWAGRFPRNR